MASRNEVSIFISDRQIGFFQYLPSQTYKSKFGTTEIDPDIIENGYIKDPEVLLFHLKSLFKAHQIKPKKLRMVIHDQNILIRQITIKKEDLKEKSISEYVKNERGKSIHFPFQNAAVTHMVRSENEEEVKIIAIIADDDLLQDYHDVFDRLGVKQVRYDLSSSALYHTYLKNSKKEFSTGMFVSLFDGFFAIQIIENDLPIFSMTEEYTGQIQGYYDIVSNYIERIANYYRFNMRKNTASIKDVILYDFAESVDKNDLKRDLIDHLTQFKMEIFSAVEQNPVLKDMPKLSLIAFASGISEELAHDDKVEFKIERRSKKVLYANYVFVLTFAVITALLVFYVPYLDMEQQIIVQQNKNNALQNQLEGLLREVPESKEWSDIEIEYSEAYDKINQTRVSPSSYYDDLLVYITSDIILDEFRYKTEEKTITLIIRSDLEVNLFEYALIIYEAYGTLGDPTIERWMISKPETKIIFESVMEVTITHA
ncbi:MAG: hypothetical protein WC134_03280 [Acholeplasmataceae bacterium]